MAIQRFLGLCPVAGARSVGKPRRYGRARVPLALKTHFPREGRAHVWTEAEAETVGSRQRVGDPYLFSSQFPWPSRAWPHLT